jgi:DNA-binding transcriptional ArsR family regulator
LTAAVRSGKVSFVNAYRSAEDPLAALGDRTRRAIIEALRDGERTVGDLAASLPVSRPAVSQHLAVLRAAGLVLERPAGTRRWYRLDPIGLVRLQERLELMWGLEGVAAPQAVPAALDIASIEPSAGPGGPPDTVETPPAAGGPGKGERKKRKKKGGRR